jgi:hypothetical protein
MKAAHRRGDACLTGVIGDAVEGACDENAYSNSAL